MVNVNLEKDTARNLMEAGRKLFAKHGYDGVSVRDICREAETNSNSVNYHFGSKQGLFESILKQFGEDMLASAKRVLASPPRDAVEFRTRLLIFMEEILSTLLDNRDLLMIVHTEFLQEMPHCDDSVGEAFMAYPLFVMDYFTKAKEAGIVKENVDVEILGSLIMKPTFMSVMTCKTEKKLNEKSVENHEYRQFWIEQNIDILLGGILTSPG